MRTDYPITRSLCSLNPMSPHRWLTEEQFAFAWDIRALSDCVMFVRPNFKFLDCSLISCKISYERLEVHRFQFHAIGNSNMANVRTYEVAGRAAECCARTRVRA